MWRSTLVMLMFLVGLLFWAWNQRVFLVNELLSRVGGDTRMQVTTLEWKDGALHVHEVSALHVPTSHRLGQAGHIEWRPTWEQLWDKNLGSVKVEGGAVDAALALFAAQNKDNQTLSSGALPWRLDSLDMASTKIILRDEKGDPLLSVTMQGNLRGGTTAISFDSTSVDGADVAWQGRSVSSRFHMDAEMKEDRIEIKKGSLQDGHFDLAWASRFYPLLRGGVDVEWEGRDIVISRSGVVQGGTHELRLKNLALEPQTGAGAVKVEAVDLKMTHSTDGTWQIQSGTVSKPEVEWTQALEDMLIPQRATQNDSTNTPTTATTPWKVLAQALEVKGGKLALSPTQMSPLTGTFGWNATLQELEISPQGVRSAAKQRLEVADLALRWGRKESSAQHPPFAQAQSITLEAMPDKLLETWQVESLAMNQPRVELTPENGPWFGGSTEAEPSASAPSTERTEAPFWQRLQFGNFMLTDASYAMAMELEDRLEASVRFDLVTEQGRQRLMIAEADMRIPKRANLPVLAFEKVEAVAVWPELWKQRRFESIKLNGGNIEVGDALMNLFKGDSQAAAVEKKVETTAARWTAAKADVANLGVTILDIAPGLPPVRFDVNLSAKETPLDISGLAANVEPQRIVLKRLRIPSPHDPLRTVAEMDLIHVNYTLDGLFHHRIDRVEILSPLLYVGEDLFWYVENYRKYMKGEAPVPDASAGPPLAPQPTTPGWRVDTLAVTDGRLMLAPKGVPIAGLNRPFPFSFTSKLESGQLDAVFDIPSDDYILPQYKLEFRGMKGHVQFNLPMKDRNNNLTETFTVEQLRWKELHMEKAHLSVTYDANGIYGQFGGQAYKGYVNGAFDIYLDEVYTWDGWISGADVSMRPICKALFPTYLILEGTATAKIVATGNMYELYQGDADFTNRGRGSFSIEALNDLIKELPPALKGDLSQQIRRIGLETLRNFDYDSVDGKARFYGREGRGHLRFTGPQGARKIDVNVYDHRWKEEPRKSETADVVEP